MDTTTRLLTGQLALHDNLHLATYKRIMYPKPPDPADLNLKFQIPVYRAVWGLKNIFLTQIFLGTSASTAPSSRSP